MAIPRSLVATAREPRPSHPAQGSLLATVVQGRVCTACAPDQMRGNSLCFMLVNFLSLFPVCVLSRSVLSDSLQPFGLQPARPLCPWDFPGENGNTIFTDSQSSCKAEGIICRMKPTVAGAAERRNQPTNPGDWPVSRVNSWVRGQISSLLSHLELCFPLLEVKIILIQDYGFK